MFKFKGKRAADADSPARIMSRIGSNTTLSVLAMGLSSLSTYLTFFDSSYTLTVSAARMDQQIQRSYSSSDNKKSISFRTYVTPHMVVSNRGTRPLVLSDLELIKSTRMDKCELGDTIQQTRIDAAIIEPGTVQQLPYEFALPAIDLEAAISEPFALEEGKELWCLRWTVFDPDGKRREPMSELFIATRTFPDDQMDNNGYPQMALDLELEHAPKRLVSKALF